MLSLLLTSVFKGILMGLSVAAPVGPICLLCVRSTLHEGRRLGFTVGLATAFGDAFYAAIAAFSLALITQFLDDHIMAFRIIGGLILLYIGSDILIKHRMKGKEITPQYKRSYTKTFISTFFLTLANPMTIFAFIAFFSALDVGDACDELSCTAAMVLGVFIGAQGWWTFLVLLFGKLGKKMSEATLKWANMISGFMIIGFGIFAILSVL